MVRAKVSAEAREMLLGHSIGLNKAYYRPGEDEILQEYLKAVDGLTINEENRLKVKVKSLESETSKIDQLQSQVVRLGTMMTKLISGVSKAAGDTQQIEDVLNELYPPEKYGYACRSIKKSNQSEEEQLSSDPSSIAK
jgi:hypothetical protein